MSDNWVLVCAEADVEPDWGYRFDHGEHTYCIYRTEQGFYATDGHCTHEEQHLAEGLVTGTQVECPLHQGRFDVITGKALSGPVCEDLRTYPVKVEDYRVWIQLAD